MSEDRFKARLGSRVRAKREGEEKKQSRKSLTAKGIGYDMVRSKYVKGPDGYGKVISAAREELIAKNGGKDPGYNVVAAHYEFGDHRGEGGGGARWKSRAWNTIQSNKHRAKNHG